MILELNENEVEVIEETLSKKMIETQDKTLLPLIKKIRSLIDN